MLQDGLLPHLDRAAIAACFARSPGNEIASGKFANPESSAALAANTFGYFLTRSADFPLSALGLEGEAISVEIERSLRFPWAGGRHPWLDAVIETPTEIVAIESKRYEPFRTKRSGAFSDAYWRLVWGEGMGRFEALRDAVRDGKAPFAMLDAVQLIKHALGLATHARLVRKRAVLVYLHAEPKAWPDGRPISSAQHARHRDEIDRFEGEVAGDFVAFRRQDYQSMLHRLSASPKNKIAEHAILVREAFSP